MKWTSLQNKSWASVAIWKDNKTLPPFEKQNCFPHADKIYGEKE